jgi:hypothetical protein
MKKILIYLSVTIFSLISNAQYSYEIINNQQGGKSFGRLATDINGNTLITGTYATTITLGSLTLNNTTGFTQNFIAMRLPNGTFSWLRKFTPLSIPGATSNIDIKGAHMDASGHVYLTGSFTGKLGFDNLTLTSTKNGSTYTYDIFTVKLAPNGAAIWARSVGTANDACNAGEYASSISTDNAGNVYVTGRLVYKVFKNTTVCNEIPGGSACTNATSKSVTAPYLVKYNSAGTKLWEKKYGNNNPALASTSCWYNHPSGLDVRTSGSNVYMTGYFYGTVSFGSVTLSTGSESISNQFILKLDGNGNTVWAKSVTGATNGGYAVGDGLVVDANEIYIRGIFNPGTINLGGCMLTTEVALGYVAKYSSDGNCQWANLPGGICYGMVRIPNGNMAMLLRRTGPVSGWYGTKEFSPADGSTINSVDALMEDTATASVGGYPNIVPLPDGYIFSQQLAGTYHFGDIIITSTYPKGGYPDMIMIRYTDATLPVAPQNEVSTAGTANMLVYPNPVYREMTIQNKDNKMLGTISIFDGVGKLVFKNFIPSFQGTLDLKELPAGFYFIRSDQIQNTIKFIKQ